MTNPLADAEMRALHCYVWRIACGGGCDRTCADVTYGHHALMRRAIAAGFTDPHFADPEWRRWLEVVRFREVARPLPPTPEGVT